MQHRFKFVDQPPITRDHFLNAGADESVAIIFVKIDDQSIDLIH